GRKSGLVHAAKVLKDVPGISINYFDEKDVVRHEIVGAIIKAYEQFELKPDEKKAEETE
ncbi:MAG: PhoH family protein, partial [Acidaminococcaceae bacterium]|nr:PhoH family protein [Acidaminococcaceae bacterium]